MKGECLALIKQFQLSDSKKQQRLATGKTNRYSFVFFYTLIVANEINKANLFQGNGDMLLLSVLFKTEEKLYLVPLLNSEWLPPEK